MVGINPDIMCHRLNVDPNYRPRRQKRHPISAERPKELKEEVEKLIRYSFICDTIYRDWVSYPILVLKPGGKWRICIDFSLLYGACLKDSFPLAQIDQMVDATAEHELLSFMYAYLGYNQIPMYPRDYEHTTFITDRGLNCYKVITFGLKNAGPPIIGSPVWCSLNWSRAPWKFTWTICQ